MSYRDDPQNRVRAHELLCANAEAIVAVEPAVTYYGSYWLQQGDRMREDLNLLLAALRPGDRLLDIGVNPPFMLSTMH